MLRAFAFVARGVARVAEPTPDANEAIAVLAVTLDELRAMLPAGAITDAMSVAVCYGGLAALAAASLPR